jgi:hypothetical protein
MSRVQAVIVLLSLAAASAHAAERQVRGGFGFQLNPLGLRGEVEATWKWRLSHSENPLLKDAHVAFGIADQTSPAYSEAQFWLEVSPLSILDLRAGANGVLYFGTFGNVLGFESYGDDFSDDARKARKEEAEAGTARRLYLTPVVKFKAGRISMRSAVDFEWWKMNDASSEFFFEPIRGTLLRGSGDSLMNATTVLLCDASRGGDDAIRLGLFHDYLKVWDAPENLKQRLGPLAVVKLGAKRFGGRNPVLSVAVLKYLDVPNRSGVGGFAAITMSLGGHQDPERAR